MFNKRNDTLISMGVFLLLALGAYFYTGSTEAPKVSSNTEFDESLLLTQYKPAVDKPLEAMPLSPPVISTPKPVNISTAPDIMEIQPKEGSVYDLAAFFRVQNEIYRNKKMTRQKISNTIRHLESMWKDHNVRITAIFQDTEFSSNAGVFDFNGKDINCANTINDVKLLDLIPGEKYKIKGNITEFFSRVYLKDCEITS